MTNKRYAKMKKIIYENYKFILCFLFCCFFFLYPLPYMIDTPGGLLPVKERVTVKNGYKASGSFNLSYVNEIHATPSTYLLSFLKKDWKLVKVEEVKYDHETLEESLERSKILLKQAEQNAVFVAYQEAGKQVKIKNTSFYVAYLDEKVTSDIKVGDLLLKINDKDITNYQQILDAIDASDVGDHLSLLVSRDGKEHELSLPILSIDHKKRLGLLLIPLYELKTSPQISFVYKNKESGSSGGLMMSLEIYNRLVKEDLTYGKTIVGTGTIEEDGTVGEIAGIEFKLLGAVKKHAEIFFVPAGDNYKEACKIKKERNLDIEIIKVKTFKDAIDALKKLREN